MLEFVTLDEAKAHLRVDTDASDQDLQLKIYSASASVFDYIQGSREKVVGSDGKVIEDAPELQRVKQATLILVGILDRVRGGEEEAHYQQGQLPFSVTSLIYSLRKPTIT
ncbi:head-tail connector protein [Candidatus Pantoea formicae]|uniref:head-tail connector protein n=1 Tax=Candidatus Pantoea formicae TaxID=2608355 RepID=UPI003ED8C693